MTQLDVRWKQRFENFQNALSQLEKATAIFETRPLSDLELQGYVQAFEFTHELAWNVLKDYMEFQGVFNLVGSRDTAREAFKRGLVDDGQAWMDMIKSRNLSSHTYNKKVVDEIVQDVITRFFPSFLRLKHKLIEEADK